MSEHLPANLDFEELRGIHPSLAEKRAAARLGAPPFVVAAWARHLSGGSLDEEAVRRAGANTSPQARGIVRRALTEELRKELRADG
jgi:hypothetical protein